MQDGVVLGGNPTFLSPPPHPQFHAMVGLGHGSAILVHTAPSSVSTCCWSRSALEGDRRVPILVYRMRLVKGCVDRVAAMAGTPSTPIALVSLSHMGISRTFTTFPSIKAERGATCSPRSHYLSTCPGLGSKVLVLWKLKPTLSHSFLTAFGLKQEAKALSEMQAHHPGGGRTV